VSTNAPAATTAASTTTTRAGDDSAGATPCIFAEIKKHYIVKHADELPKSTTKLVVDARRSRATSSGGLRGRFEGELKRKRWIHVQN